MAIEIVSLGISALTLIAVVVRNYTGSEAKIKENSEDILELKREVNEIKENYLDRFATVNENIQETREQVIERLVRIETKLEKEFWIFLHIGG